MKTTIAHSLFDSQAGKTTKLTCQENVMTTETDTGGKIRSASKTFATPAEAMQQFQKKEWELLKKGAVMKAEGVAPGDALLHLFIGGGYTGCLSFVATAHGIYVYRSAGDGGVMGKQDELLCIKDGNIADVLTLPGLLPWEIHYDAQQDQLLMDIDHYIYLYDFASALFTRLTQQLNMPASFVSLCGNTRAYATHPFYYISHSPYNQRTEKPLEVSIVRGSIPICASLSPDGRLLALHHQEGEVALLNTETNEVERTLKGEFGLVGQLIWTKDNKQLMVHKGNADQRLLFFDTSTGEQNTYPGLALPVYSQDISDCCINADNTLLVCLQRSTAFVFDFTSKTFLYEFPVSHSVKRAQINFVDEKTLGVRTDYGCFSLYQL